MEQQTDKRTPRDGGAPLFRSGFRTEKERKDRAVYDEFVRMMGVPGQSKLKVIFYLMDKFGIYSQSTVYNIIKRVGARLAAEEGAEL